MTGSGPHDKVISLTEAIAEIRSGDRVALGGIQMSRRPFGAVRQLLLGEVFGLEIITYSVCIDTDVLMADRRVSCLRYVAPRKTTLGPPPAFADALRTRSIRTVPESGASLGAGLRAALAKVAFLPIRHTDTGDAGAERDDLVVIDCPYSGVPLVAIPPIRPDVALLHVQAADRRGNLRIDTSAGLDQEMALSAAKTFATAEAIVDDLGGGGLQISGRHVDAVVELPYGAFPAACLPHYKWDLGFTLAYYDAVREGQFDLFRESLAVRSYDHFLEISRSPGPEQSPSGT